jgi:FMN phosphatase YigB (HAD superfamily)
MKTILVDAVDGLIIKESEEYKIFEEMKTMLNSFPNPKIVVTGANDEQYKKFGLDNVPYAVFTLKHNPEKTDPKYFEALLNQYSLISSDVIYFEHNPEAVKSAESLGIKSYWYDPIKRNLDDLRKFIKENL